MWEHVGVDVIMIARHNTTIHYIIPDVGFYRQQDCCLPAKSNYCGMPFMLMMNSSPHLANMWDHVTGMNPGISDLLGGRRWGEWARGVLSPWTGHCGRANLIIVNINLKINWSSLLCGGIVNCKLLGIWFPILHFVDWQMRSQRQTSCGWLNCTIHFQCYQSEQPLLGKHGTACRQKIQLWLGKQSSTTNLIVHLIVCDNHVKFGTHVCLVLVLMYVWV